MISFPIREAIFVTYTFTMLKLHPFQVDKKWAMLQNNLSVHCEDVLLLLLIKKLVYLWLNRIFRADEILALEKQSQSRDQDSEKQEKNIPYEEKVLPCVRVQKRQGLMKM